MRNGRVATVSFTVDVAENTIPNRSSLILNP